MDTDTKRLLIFAGGVGAVLLLLIAASLLTGRHSGQVPIVVADSSPIRIKPENPGGMKIDAAENDVFSGGSDTGNARLAPPAEAPDPKALRAAEAAGIRPAPTRAPATDGAVSVAPPPPPPGEAGPAPAHAQALAGGAALPVPPASPAGAGSAPARAPALVGAGSAVPPPPTPLNDAQSPALAPQARSAEKLAMVTPPAPPQHNDAAGSKLGAAAHAAPADAKAASRHVMVQLAAVESDAAAKAEWERLRGRNRDLFEGRQLVISRSERDGHTYWRVRTSGFADVAQARTFCDRVHAKGGGCSIVEY